MTAPLAPGAPESTPAAPVAVATPVEPAAPVVASAAPAEPAVLTPDNDVKSLPDWAQKLITDARSEAGKARTTAKQNAADEAKAEIAQTIAKALGIVDADAPPDPVKLTAQVAEQTATARQAQVELAVFRNADAAAGDPGALLDSRTFLADIKDVDPSDGAAIQAAITKAVTANPRLGRTEPVAPGMRPNPAQGRSASAPLGVAERIAAAEEAAQKTGDNRAAIRLKAALALNSQP